MKHLKLLKLCLKSVSCPSDLDISGADISSVQWVACRVSFQFRYSVSRTRKAGLYSLQSLLPCYSSSSLFQLIFSLTLFPDSSWLQTCPPAVAERAISSLRLDSQSSSFSIFPPGLCSHSLVLPRGTRSYLAVASLLHPVQTPRRREAKPQGLKAAPAPLGHAHHALPTAQHGGD